MEPIITALSSGLTAFFSFQAYVILPVFMLLLALIARMKFTKAIFATIKIGAGFAGVFVVFTFFVSQISPAIKSIIALRGLDYPIVDVGWPPLAAITWSSSLTPLIIPLIMLVNLIMLLTRTTKTLYIDLWNYWHFAIIGVLIHNVTHNMYLGLASSLIIAVYTIKTSEWSAPYVKRELDLEGIAVSPLSVAGFLPYAVVVNRFFDMIPGFKKLTWDPSRTKKNSDSISLLQEPMVLGIFVGIFLSLLAGYNLKMTLETSINIAAVMFLLPRCGGLIGEGMGEISLAFKLLMERRFTRMKGISIAMDTGFLLTNPSVIATGLILIPISLLIAFVLPGNRVIPLGDLPNLISVMALTVLIMKGNVIRAVISGIPIVATFMLIASKLAPLFTVQAVTSGVNLGEGIGEITAFTDGGNQLRYWFFWLFQGNIIALCIIPVVLLMLFYSWKKYKKMSIGE